MIVRWARESDVERLAELEQQCFATQPWSSESIRHDICENEKAKFIVADMDSKIVGYIIVWVVEGEGSIMRVAVDPGYRERQIGSALMEVLIELMNQDGVYDLTLEVRESNEIAREFYTKFGFGMDGMREGYYQDNGENAVIMWRHTKKPVNTPQMN